MKSRKRSHHVLWIEVERCKSDELNKDRAEKATKVIRKLGIEYGRFEWNAQNSTYLFVEVNGCFTELPDDGHFFNLDYLSN